jgi:hypothetical protein
MVVAAGRPISASTAPRGQGLVMVVGRRGPEARRRASPGAAAKARGKRPACPANPARGVNPAALRAGMEA